MAKKKRQGHYCRICDEYKANEKFSGKGHARHICKSCMSSGKNKSVADKTNFAIPTEAQDESWDESSMEELFGSLYNPFNSDIDILPAQNQNKRDIRN